MEFKVICIGRFLKNILLIKIRINNKIEERKKKERYYI